MSKKDILNLLLFLRVIDLNNNRRNQELIILEKIFIELQIALVLSGSRSKLCSYNVESV